MKNPLVVIILSYIAAFQLVVYQGLCEEALRSVDQQLIVISDSEYDDGGGKPSVSVVDLPFSVWILKHRALSWIIIPVNSSKTNFYSLEIPTAPRAPPVAMNVATARSFRELV